MFYKLCKYSLVRQSVLLLEQLLAGQPVGHVHVFHEVRTHNSHDLFYVNSFQTFSLERRNRTATACLTSFDASTRGAGFVLLFIASQVLKPILHEVCTDTAFERGSHAIREQLNSGRMDGGDH